MPFGIGGTALTAYVGRVWIVNGVNLIFSAPGSYTDFSTADGGGVTPSNIRRCASLTPASSGPMGSSI